MKRKELKILGLSYSQTQIGSYVCVLSEKRGGRKLPIIIKTPEAQRIAIEIEGIKSSRTLTHDIIKGICDSFELDVQEVFIYALLEGVFYCKIVVSNGLYEMEVEAPIGDALAALLYSNVQYSLRLDILDSTAIDISDDGSPSQSTHDDEDEFEFDDDEDDFDNFIDDGKKERIVSIEDLEILMQNAIENEEYEIAAEIRDRIQTLKDQ